jgi:prepilin-type N-terminal cleavage/methylation domain-containing protein
MTVTMKRCTPRRAGFTLLEVILTTAIAVLLLAALYVSFDIQMGTTQAGRELVYQTTLARTIHNRIRSDINSTMALCDASRFRLASGNSSGMGGSTTGSTSPTSGTSGTTGTTGTSGTGTSGTSGTSGTTNTATEEGAVGTTILPVGLQGNAQQLVLYTSKVPSEYFRLSPDEPMPIVSDQRRIIYWLVPNGGLARVEYKQLTSTNINPFAIPEDEQNYILAPEIKDLSFEYFNGTSWAQVWDSSTLGADGVTPVGPPRAVAVTLGLVDPTDSSGQVKYYRHVIAIPTADGIPQTIQGSVMP